MPGEIKYWVVLKRDGLWKFCIPKSGIVATDKSLPTCLRRAATKLAKLGVK